MRPRLILVFTALLLSGCSLPQVFKVTVQQGNLITQEMVDQLKPGMTRSQVAFVMGEPVFRNPFENDRWDYIYTVEIPGRYQQRRLMSLYFVDERLAYFTGDFVPSDAEGGSAGLAAEEAGEDGAAATSGAREGPAGPA